MKYNPGLKVPYWGDDPLVYADRDSSFRDNEPFWALMTLQSGVVSGRSAKRVCWHRADVCCSYQMFVSTLVDVILENKIEHGTLHGYWAFCKKGQNYGLIFVGKEL